MSDLDELQSRLKNLTSDYEALKKMYEEQVTQWVWFKGEYGYPSEPFFFERRGQKQGKRLAEKPSNKKKQDWDCYQYGFDKQNRMLIERSNFHAYSQSYQESFLIHRDNIIEMIRYDYDMDSQERQAIALSTYYFEGDKLISTEFVGVAAITTETYKYAKGILTDVEHHGWRQAIGANKIRYFQENNSCEKYTYNEAGQLSCIRRLFPNGSEETIYQRLTKKENVKNLLSTVEHKLIEIVLQLVGGLNISEKVYCLALVYASDMVLPPAIAIGLERDRSSWLDQVTDTKSDSSLEAIWSPEDFFYYNQASLEISDEEFIAMCTLLNQQLQIKGKMNLANNLLNKVAAKLMEVDWSTLLNITSDFIVYATDFEQADFYRNIKVSVPKSRRTLLRRNGFL